MPAFIHGKRDEKKWSSAKTASAKETRKGSTGYWKLANFIFHKMKKREQAPMEKGNQFPTPPGGMAPLKAGSGQLAVKMPKPKKMGDGLTSTQSTMIFKSDKANKQPSIEKLKSFLIKKNMKHGKQ